jgi:hypothetical protein
MGKIEDTFGSREAANEFTQFALGQPVLRLSMESGKEYPDSRTYKAVSGFIVGRLVERIPEQITGPTMDVELYSSTKHIEDTFIASFSPVGENIKSRALIIKNPVHDSTNLRENMYELVSSATDSTLTIVTHTLILESLKMLEEASEVNRSAYLLSRLAKLSLRNMWEHPDSDS